MSQFFAFGGQSIAASASVLPVNIQGWFLLGLTGLISLQSKGLSRVLSSTTVQKQQFLLWIWELNHKESWAPKNWFFWTVVLEKTLERYLNFKEIKPVNPKGNQPWIFTGETDTEAEAPILGTPDVKSQLIGKDPDAGKDWRQEEKGITEDKMVGWHHQLNAYEFEQAPGDGEGQGSLGCSSPWGRKELGMTEWLNKTTRNSSKQTDLKKEC